jgi:putative exosortase-associated protein (TIGR04073 family)
MLKRSVVIAIVLLLAAGIVNSGYCDTAIQKLGRGLANVGGAPYELYLQPCRTNASNGLVSAVIVGIPKGVFMTALRMGVGVYEVGTFLIPIPRCYGPVLKDEPQILVKDLDWKCKCK